MSAATLDELALFPSDDDAGGLALASPPPRRRPARPSKPKPTAMEMCVLGSGSGGNCTVVRLGADAVLLDAGFGPATTARRLAQAKVPIERVKAFCLTHLDQDHFRPHWVPTLQGWGIRVFIHRWHLPDWRRVPGGQGMLEAGLVSVFDGRPFEPIPGLEVSPVRLAHDAQGTSGFHLRSEAGRIGYATDLGHVPETLIDLFAGVDVLAIESNYDPPMQVRSPRPLFLKRRIMGPAGHLSNEQAFDAVRRIVERSPEGSPKHIVLLHRSQQCNCPLIVREVFTRDERFAARVVLTEQRRRTRWFGAACGRKRAGQTAAAGQMCFEFGGV